MARLARVVLPNTPHHITQRGNRRHPVFFEDDDYRYYLALIDEFAQKAGTRVIAYCLMPNHVHFILKPEHRDGLRAALGEAHRRYTRYINFRENWRGHLWQERFHSYPMDDAHLWMAVRYVELNPVAADLVAEPTGWPWSSANAHVLDQADPYIQLSPVPNLADDWSDYLACGVPTHEEAQVEQHLRTGRPLGNDAFIDKAERRLGRTLRKQPPGPKAKG
ncbi:transposase [Salinisphaera sp. Q1T1-3]|uniref:transposase n=1 Tax=Salinisphaera sp. Q1T1-3 TaxID=2321229 RepID=UPI000E72BC71|nr:transposase [Salinisphaera sp. Q1T1-3]RJS93228.1 transposase [Salinisphaera sp. Q1T1-3]